jgi:histidyl-tRNA synthetase
MPKPSLPKGTRDFSPETMIRRNYIFYVIEDVFKLFGYQPIETPAMENLSSLLGKYGEEGDKLLFKVLNSGDFLDKVDASSLSQPDPGSLSLKICEKGLRYDLTVPFARYVVQHRNEIHFPFKRYQIQPVWRADRPQKGRYREFYQCDVDIIGSISLLNEAELIQIIDLVFKNLDVSVHTRINNRKVLAGIAEVMGMSGKMLQVAAVLDKMEKIGREGVLDEMEQKGAGKEVINRLKPFLELTGRSREKITTVRSLLKGSDFGIKGVEEIETLLNYLDQVELTSEVIWDVPLARGLDYYTGTIIEVISTDLDMGSLCGGGRYDDLAGVFGMDDISGVGISFGADRIFDVMVQLDKFPESTTQPTKLLFVNFGAKEEGYILSILNKIRNAGIPSEIYPEQAKLKKQMAYADSRKIPFVALMGENEMASGTITLRNMITGEQQEVTLDKLIQEILIR